MTGCLAMAALVGVGLGLAAAPALANNVPDPWYTHQDRDGEYFAGPPTAANRYCPHGATLHVLPHGGGVRCQPSRGEWR